MTWKITTLIENHPDRQEELACEHGLSMLIETDGFRLLMDTGSSGAFHENADKLNVSLKGIDGLLISHAHYDHAGGLLRFIREEGNPKKLYVGDGFFKKSFHNRKDGRTDYVGIGFDRKMIEDLGVRICEITEDSVELYPGLTLHRNFRNIYEWEPLDDAFVYQSDALHCFGGRCMDSMVFAPDDFREETAVTLDTPDGLVVIVGCSHPGVMNIITTIEERTGRHVCGVIGGIHLMDSDRNRLDRTIEAFKDHDFKLVAVCHCTGEKQIPLLREAMPECFVFNCTGNVIEIDSIHRCGYHKEQT